MKRCASRRSEGAGSVQSLMAKPLCGNFVWMALRASVSASLLVACIVGELEAIGPADEAAGLHELGAVESVEGHEDARAVGEAIGEAVGLRAEDAAHGDIGLADGEAVADLEAEAIKQRLFHQNHACLAPGRAGACGLDARSPRRRGERRRRRP